MLYMLLKLQKDNHDRTVIGLSDLISTICAEMQVGDVAIVEKRIAELH